MRWFDGFPHGVGVAALSAVFVLGAGAIQTAGANEQDAHIAALAYDPGTDTLLKAQARALFRSSDRGRSWQAIVIPALENGRIASIAVSAPGKGVTYVVGTGLGVLRTEDGGKRWVERSEGLPARDVIAVAAHSTQPETVYVVVPDHGVYRSQDKGKNWRLMDRGSQSGITQLIHSDMAGSKEKRGGVFPSPKRNCPPPGLFFLLSEVGKKGRGTLTDHH